MKEKDKKLTDIIDGMSLEDKALMLTQYPIDSICGNKEIVTGCWDMDGMTNDMIMRVGTVLNVANGETADRIRAIRKENGIDDPLMFMLDVIHGYRTIFPIPLAMACSFDTELVEECARIAAVEAAADGVDAIFTPTDNTIMTAELSIYETLIDAGIPHYTGADSFALNGAFLGYGVDYANLGVETANMIAQVLVDGADPASTPVMTFDNGTATVNTETCEALGLDYGQIEEAFAPLCTKVQSIVTAESFDDLKTE